MKPSIQPPTTRPTVPKSTMNTTERTARLTNAVHSFHSRLRFLIRSSWKRADADSPARLPWRGFPDRLLGWLTGSLSAMKGALETSRVVRVATPGRRDPGRRGLTLTFDIVGHPDMPLS